MSVVAAQAFFCFPFDFQFPIGWPTAGCWHMKFSTATWQLFNFNGQSGRNLQSYLMRRIVKSLQTIAKRSSESKCQKHGFKNVVAEANFPRDQNPARNPLSDHHSAHKKQHHVPMLLLVPPNPKSTDVMSRPPKPYRCESAPMSMDQSAPMSMDPCPGPPLTPTPLTPCPGPQNPKGVSLCLCSWSRAPSPP